MLQTDVRPKQISTLPPAEREAKRYIEGRVSLRYLAKRYDLDFLERVTKEADRLTAGPDSNRRNYFWREKRQRYATLRRAIRWYDYDEAGKIIGPIPHEQCGPRGFAVFYYP